MSSRQSIHDQPVPSCDTAVALGDTTSGGVLLAKNSDRSSHEAQRLIGAPAAQHDAGSTLRCQYIAIPQVARTAALIGSQPYWLWGFEHGMNEHGVAIGNEAIFTREAPQESGLLGMDLVRLGLERGTTAREALEVITALLEQYGQGGSTSHHATSYYDNSFLIADPREAWVLESCGRQWAALHLRRGAYSISNRPTIGADHDLASDDLVHYAEERGWWPHARRPFNFAEAYTDHGHGVLAGATCRLDRSRYHLAAGAQSGSLTVPGMMALLRDHGPEPAGGSAWLRWPTGREVTTVCMHGHSAFGSTAASMVAHLVPGAVPTYWASMAPPCTGVFLPCWVDAGPPALLAEADEAPSATSPWWRFRRLWEAVTAAPDPEALAERFRRAWQPLEERLQRQVTDLAPTTPAGARRALTEAALGEALEVLAHLEQEIMPAGVAADSG